MSLPLLFYNLVVVFIFGIGKFKIKLVNSSYSSMCPVCSLYYIVSFNFVKYRPLIFMCPCDCFILNFTVYTDK